MEFLGEFCFYLIRLWNDIFVMVKVNVFGMDGGRLVLGVFFTFRGFFFTFRACRFCFLQRPSTFILERLLSCVKIALIVKRVCFKCFKTLSRSIYTHVIIEGSDKGKKVL